MSCAIEGCDLRVKGRGWCSIHYQRWVRYGDPLETSTHRLGTLLPFAPLWNLVRPENQGELAERLGVTQRTIVRWKKHGVPLVRADEVAVKLGMHAQSIWPGCEA